MQKAGSSLWRAMEQRVKHYQPGPRLGNSFLEDTALQRFLNVFLEGCPAADKKRITDDLTQFGDKVCGEYIKMAENAERFKPMLEQYDQWGRRVDRLHLSEGWKFFKKESAVEGIVSIPYESPTQYSRIHQAFKLFMFEPSSGMFGCPLAMTDGATYAINSVLESNKTAKQPYLQEKTIKELEDARFHLTTRDPSQFWTSGQWFTEKRGGSDLSRSTDTFAVPNESRSSTHQLFGFKWFTSAVDSEMTLTLANITDNQNADMINDRKPLSMFFLRTRRDESRLTEEDKLEHDDILNGIKVVRLKDKMATRSLPTAELLLEGADAHLISPAGAGIKNVTPMLVITRFHNSITAAAYSARMRNAAIDFAHRRNAFGDRIVDKPLHIQSLFEYDMDTRGNMLMVFEMGRLLGLVENGKASEEEDNVLRVMTSLAKLFTARECVRLMSDGVELFGAVGVMENHMSTIFRDSAVLPIWEGTTNTLALDLLRVSAREPECIAALYSYLSTIAGDIPELKDNISKVFGFIKGSASQLDKFEWNARRLSMNLSRLLVACLAVKMSKKTGHKEDVAMADYWIGRVVRQYEEMTDPSMYETYRSSIPQAMNGDKKDTKGRPRSYL